MTCTEKENEFTDKTYYFKNCDDTAFCCGVLYNRYTLPIFNLGGDFCACGFYRFPRRVHSAKIQYGYRPR